MATLELRGLKKKYGSIFAVDGIDIAIKEGEFLAISIPSTAKMLPYFFFRPRSSSVAMDLSRIAQWLS